MREYDRPSDGDDADGSEGGDGLRLVIPDDLSGMRADVLAYHREQAARLRRERWAARTDWFTRLRWYGVSVPLVLAGVLAVAGVAALLVLAGPRGPIPPGTTTPVVTPGKVGGRLPATPLVGTGRGLTADTLAGPAVVLLVPATCDCASTVTAVRDAATARQIATYVVATTSSDGVYADPTGSLLLTYGSVAAAPTLLRIDGDGVVLAVRAAVTATDAVADVAG